MLRSILTITLISLVGASMAQSNESDWNWPEEEEMLDMAKEKQAYYKIQMLQDNYNGALATLNWLYTNNGNLNPSIYKDGVKSIENILKGGADEQRKERLEDSLLWMYDQRLKYFEDNGSVLDRKAYTAFRLYYKTPAKYSLLLSLYEEAYSENGNQISDFNLTPYVTLASYYYKTKPSEMPMEKLLEVYDKVSAVLDEKMKTGNKTKLEKERNKIDAILSSFGDIINCEFIENNFVSKFREDPSNIALAKKIFSYSLKAKCSNEPYFLEAGEAVYKESPTYALARALGDKFFADDSYDKAIQFYQSAFELADDDEAKANALLGHAAALSKQGKKSSSRAKARKVIAFGYKKKEAYNLIGNLYLGSFDDCKGGESKVQDRSIFIAAYNMYKLAGNEKQMAAAKEQFPSIEEIFSENYKENQEINTGCWIGETVVLQRR